MTTPAEDPLRRRVVHETAKFSDIDVHCTLLTGPDGKRYFEIREYLTSMRGYGRGLTLPLSRELVEGIMEGLLAIRTLTSEEVEPDA